MANIIPDIDINTIENDGEKAFYQAAGGLPTGYTVLYSFKYLLPEEDEALSSVREADFVIVHPGLGYLVVEVKQGDVAFVDGRWCEFKRGDYIPMSKNPVEQARKAMFAILHEYKKQTDSNFPLSIKYAICFPECSRIYGVLPRDLDAESVLLFDDLKNLEQKIFNIFGAKERRKEIEAVNLLLNKILCPSFKIFARLEDRIDMFHRKVERVLTEEQERVLEETELDRRKIFFGAAGSGKTYIAMEKARRIAGRDKRVFLTCYNKNLARVMFSGLPSGITASNFHSYTESILEGKGFELENIKIREGLDRYYKEILPEMAFDYYTNVSEEERFDAVIVDEGQDFNELWITCLEAMLKDDGEFYIFADPKQNLFGADIDRIKRIPLSKHRLTRNLRNAEPINEWINDIVPGIHLKCSIKGGIPVKHFEWETPKEEKKMIEAEIGRLVSQGVQLKRVVILSPYRKENSCLAGVERIKEWSLTEDLESGSNAVRFQTIRSFKGLEADIVFLIGVKKDSRVCTEADIYVGGSRARFLLYIFREK